jgi:hypothetical protein
MLKIVGTAALFGVEHTRIRVGVVNLQVID